MYQKALKAYIETDWGKTGKERVKPYGSLFVKVRYKERLIE